MDIFILRHGEAGSKNQCAVANDRERFLTQAGQVMCQQAGSTLSALSESKPVNQIIHSPFLRTTQTASIVHRLLEEKGGQPIELLANQVLLGDNAPHAVSRWLNHYVNALPEDSRIVLVSHQPLVARLLEWWVAGTNTFTQLSFNHPFNVASLAQLSFSNSANQIGQGCADLVAMHHHNILK